MSHLPAGSERPNILRVLGGEALWPTPLWLMRQAGRYLPEYRQTRERAGSFLDLCYTPELAAEVTLQPIRRFDFDAAILFSDILVIPQALGQAVDFIEGRGPVLAPLVEEDLSAEGLLERLAPVFQTVRLVRSTLAREKALIGFCGAPWTVATYMIAGGAASDQMPARRMAFEDPARLQRLIDRLVDASATYLIAQIDAGADIVKIFDSWAGVLDAEGFERWALAPVAEIVRRVKAHAPHVPVIAFPRGAGARLGGYAEHADADALAIDWSVPMDVARSLVPERFVLQGNLDPLRLVAGGPALASGVDMILAAMEGRPHIFNLGHGILPNTPPDHVAQLVELVRRPR